MQRHLNGKKRVSLHYRAKWKIVDFFARFSSAFFIFGHLFLSILKIPDTFFVLKNYVRPKYPLNYAVNLYMKICKDETIYGLSTMCK
jgi:hypothetical protein